MLKLNNLFLYVLTLLFLSCQTKEMNSKLLINHTGYKTNGIKSIVLQTQSNNAPKFFEIINSKDQVVFKENFKTGGNIDNWHTGKAYAGNFTKFNEIGEFYISTKIEGELVKSRLFSINNLDYADKSLSILIEGIESQHSVGEFDEKDKKMTFFGERKDTIDVRGGWYDASGDRGKYLSHLCYSNYFNPQQTPLIVWSLFESINQSQLNNKTIKADVINSMKSEAVFGADFLMRMQDPEGYFYTNVFANWSWDPEKREICAYEGQDGIKTDEYQAGFREGGGVSIAALARASKESNGSKNFTPKQYLEAAKKGFSHLVENNTKYIDDGKENIIDDYCVLLAATELFAATNEPEYLVYAQKRMQQLTNRIKSDNKFDGWWSANDEASRPFFHGVESGLPLIALKRYLDFEQSKELIAITIEAIQKSIDFELQITNSVHNPFGYPRQYVKATNETSSKASFFIPHNNETGYWWQGENSRLASIASAFNMTQEFMTETQKLETMVFTSNCMNWIFGLNPYDVGMVEGIGYNNPDYRESVSLNFKGGVCNGITSGFSDENDISFMPLPQDNDGAHKWRWSEQWMPHAAWLVLAVSSEK